MALYLCQNFVSAQYLDNQLAEFHQILFIVRWKTRMTWNLILKFFSLLILVVEALYIMNPTDATLASLSVLKYSRWHPRWPSVRLL